MNRGEAGEERDCTLRRNGIGIPLGFAQGRFLTVREPVRLRLAHRLARSG
jgi:hypothetical protein